ncbi:YqaJ viral recombinase family nuclease [Acidihalobacter prosperus]|uniref:YqaJ viral recombinase domain-containing protein n=1 Tax=Acidihalobacter prosperus TaxID=160660 RepID=A0A1A6C316_9GAMM|nr:YqaJ viral recombinase family protein [Acidihalobacter prosperus]OBS08951.1 hypothetical protein Thpro_022068 [Acidihalobacter prosperus]
MKIVNLDQKSEAWLDWRRNGITASESPVTTGHSPYKTPWRLWAEKTGKVAPEYLSRNPNVRRGEGNEDRARQCYEERHNVVLLPVCAEWSANPLFRASLDGLTDKRIPVELKAPSSSVMAEVLEQGEASKAYQLYWWQVQHQMLVTEADKGVLCFYLTPEESDTGEEVWKEFEIARDPQAIDEIIAAGEAFWQMVKDRKEPPKDPERDEFVPENLADIRAWKASAGAWLEHQSNLKRLEEQMKDLKQAMGAEQDKLVQLMGEFVRANAFGVQLTRFQVQGSIDWNKVREDLLPNLSDAELDGYRKKPRQQVRMAPSSEVSEKAVKADVKAAIAESAQAEQQAGEGQFAW